MVTTLYLIRHCQAEGNFKMLCHGQTDGQVTEMGKLQLQALSGASGGWNLSAIYASPLIRAMETAKAVNENYHLPIQTDEALKELYFGEWEGRSWKNVAETFPESYSVWKNTPEKFEAPGGETMKEAYDRIVSCISSLVRKHPGETIAIAGHSLVFRCYLAHVIYHELRDLLIIGMGDNTYICKITFDENFVPTLCYKYNASHLSEDISTTAFRRRNGIEAPKSR